MVNNNNHDPPGLAALLGRVGRTALRGIDARVELLAVELQEERLRLREVLIWSVVMLVLGVMAVLLITAAIIFSFPEGSRMYATVGLAILYLLGTVVAWFGLRAGFKREPFTETIEQAKKDRLWLESLK